MRQPPNPTAVYIANTILAVGALVLAGLGKVSWLEAAAFIGVMLVPSAAFVGTKPQPPAAGPGILSMLLLVLGLSLGVVACPQGAPSPKQVVGAGVVAADAACTILEGLTPNRTVIQACATAEEVAAIADFVAKFLRHGDAPARTATLSDARTAAEGVCTPLPGTVVCATREELGAGIQALLVRRRAPFTDAGGQ